MRDSLRGIARPAAVAVVSFLFVLPVLFLIVGSLRLPGLPPPSGVEWWPRPASVDGYRFVFHLVPLHHYLVNSMIVVGIAVPVTVVIASCAGFSIARSGPRFARAVVGVSVAAMMVPPVALWVPRFVLYRELRLTDTLWPLIVPAFMATTPFFVLLFAVWYARMPRSLFEAAELDLGSPWRVWWRVAVPLSRPAFAAVGVLAFAFHWSNFTDALLYLNRPELRTIPLGLRALQTLEPANFPILLAGAVIATVPAVAAFLVAQRPLFKEVVA